VDRQSEQLCSFPGVDEIFFHVCHIHTEEQGCN
jgi:hypothetical protein